MCISPIRIKNPNLGIRSSLSFLKDTTSAYINIPCGKCGECRTAKQIGLIQRVQMEALENYLFFCTLTYSPETLPVVNINGRDIPYADIKDVQNMMKRLRKSNVFGRSFRYFGVSERGSKRGRPHFHIIFFVPKLPEDTAFTPLKLERVLFSAVLHEWRRNYGSTRKPVYKPLCRYYRKYVNGRPSFNFDLHYVSPSTKDGSQDDVAFYVSKYIMKASKREEALQRALRMNLEPEDYFHYWPIVKSKSFRSVGFGRNPVMTENRELVTSDAIVKHIRNCVQRSKGVDSPFAMFYLTSTGQTFPLCRYYRNRPELYSLDDHLTFFYNNPDGREDCVVFFDRDISTLKRIQQSFEHRFDIIDSKDASIIYNSLN